MAKNIILGGAPKYWTYLLVNILLLLLNFNEANLKKERPPYEEFFNYGVKKLKPTHRGLENEIIKSKVEVLGDVLKNHVNRLRKIPGQNVELVFLVDSSASVGADNFFNELKFVKKLLADFTVSYNQTRVAVVTFSSKSKVIRHIDHVTQASTENHKCSLLERELPQIRYSGGGTYTLGALMEAQGVLAISRNDAVKAVFLVTDGYSNGGDPRPAAEFLKNRGVIIFTFGIQNGNVKELYDMASEPKEEHSYILDSFEEFEALARRALHEDLHSGIMIGQDSAACSTLCDERDDCCDDYARCTCGTHTGHYACTCRLGFYGTGLKGDCKPCPIGTYRDVEGPSDVTACKSCPDANMLSPKGSTSPYQCYCNRGYTQSALKCERKQCPILSPPANGYFVRGTCERVVNAACGMRCRSGYSLNGSSIRLCREDGTWSGGDATCVMKTCPMLTTPRNGDMICSSETKTIDTQCHFTCKPGYQLVGSRMRTCLPVAMWDGISAYCKPIFCPPIPNLNHGIVKPESCKTGKIKYGTICEFGCNNGYQLSGPLKTKCIDQGIWSEGQQEARCIDVEPPVIQCPKNVHATTEPNENYAIVTWDKPFVKDSSKSKVKLSTTPATKQPMRMKIGTHNIIYVAKDEWGNQDRCIFTIIVKDKEPPRIDSCVSPPTFLSRDEIVDVYWEEPLFSDNSGKHVKVKRSKDPGSFPQGETVVKYVATDFYGNKASCNITINVQHHACDLPLDPINGVSNCTENPSAVHCTLTCSDGYAFAMRPTQDYFCAYDGVWQPDNNPLPFPDCSLTSLSNTISQNGEIALEDDGSVCDDIFFMGQVENTIQQKLEEALSTVCADDFLCEIATVEAVCEGLLDEAEEEYNTIFSKRKKRDVGSEENYFRQYWPTDNNERWIYWKRGNTDLEVARYKRSLGFKSTKQINSKRQFGFPTSIFGSKKTNVSLPIAKTDTSYMGVLTGLIIKNLGKDIGMTRISSFLSGLGKKEGSYAFNDFLAAFAKEFGEEKANDLRTLAGSRIGNKRKERADEVEDFNQGSDYKKSKFAKYRSSKSQMNWKEEMIMGNQNDDSSVHLTRNKKTLKLKFKLEGQGNGKEALELVDSAVQNILKAAEKGNFDIQIGIKQLKVAAVRLSEDPEYVCDPGSVLQDNLCVKCPVGTFFNVIDKECQSCQAGSFQPKEGQVSCLVCPANTSTKKGQAKSDFECKAMCLPGSYSNDTLEPCITCSIGEYQDEYASSSCAPCPYSTTTWRRGAWTVEECKPPCPTGQVSETGIEPCLPCPRGYFQPELGSTTCNQCPENSTTDKNESDSLYDCIGISEDSMAAYTTFETLAVNECFSYPCKNGAYCKILESGFSCVCSVGFVGQLCESEIDECQVEPCLNNGTCIDLLGAFKCNCSSGFKGENCQENIDECDPNPCMNNASCVDKIDSFKCLCEPGFTGKICDININECNIAPCANNSTCIDGISDYTCQCQPGYTGRHCTTDVDECDVDPCIHGTCTDLINAFKCSCEQGYEGPTCSLDIDDCKSSPCQNNATCTDWLNGFSCNCEPGYGGKLCENQLSTDFSFEFASSGIINYASVENFSRELSSVTVCFWMRTRDKNNYGTPFSYATDTYDNALTLTDYSGFVLYINGEKTITDVSANDGQWHMICVEWESAEGSWLIFKDGIKIDSGKGLSKGKTIAADGVFVLGQEQDQRGGKYSAPESFVGEISLLNIWSTVLEGKQLRMLYNNCERYDGDIRSWSDFQKGMMGQIKLQASSFCKGCGVPIPPLNGVILEGGSETGITIKIGCKEGYKIYLGDEERTCLVNGIWSGKEPECRPVSCGYPGHLRNGKVLGMEYFFEDTLRYSCNKGFKLIGNMERKCTANGKWDSETPNCEVIKCPDPDAVTNGKLVSHLGSYLPSNKAQYSCQQGYQMDGPSVRTCGGDGMWKGQLSTCQPETCKHFPKIPNSITEKSNVERGTSIVIQCQDGFKIQDKNILWCNQEGQWERPFPKCIKAVCQKPPYVENGNVKIKVSAMGREAKYKCDTGFVVEGKPLLRCQKNGEWDFPFSKCVPQPCPQPELPQNGIIKEIKSWRVGDEVEYSCKVGFLLIGNSKKVCEEGYFEGSWVGDTPQCQEVKCNAPMPVKGGSFIVIEPINKGIEINFPDSEVEVFRYKRKAILEHNHLGSSNHHGELDLGQSREEIDYSQRPSGGLEISEPKEDFDYGQTPSGNLEFSQPAGDLDYGQSPSGGLEFGQSQGSFDYDQSPSGDDLEFGQSQGGFDYGQTPSGGLEFGQSQGDYGPTPSGGLEFGQSQGGFDYGQTPSGGLEFGQSQGGFDYGQSPSGGFEFGQSQGGFDYGQTPSEGLEFGQTQGSFDYGQSPDNSFDDGFNFDYPDKPDKLIRETYDFDTKLEYKCRPGFKLIGSNILRCGEKGDWDEPEPTCYEQHCLDLDHLDDGFLNYFGSGATSRVEFQCNDGFELVGNSEITCQPNRKWTDKVPICIQLKCDKPVAPANSTVNYDDTGFGSIATYECLQGFVLEGSFERVCGFDGIWNGSMPRCVAIVCATPSVIDKGYIYYEGNLDVGSVVEYGCNECYKINGTTMRECQLDETWTLEEPACELIHCDNLSELENGKLIGGDNSCGSIVEFECNPGYKMIGKRKASCMENGKWSSPIVTCKQVSCPEVHTLFNGKVKGSSFQFMDQIKFECNAGYRLSGKSIITCTKEKIWSDDFPICKIKFCEKPKGPSNGRVRVSGLFYKASIKIVCDPGYKIDGDSVLKCNADAKWDKEMPFCAPIICPPAPEPSYAYYNSTEVYFESFTTLKYSCDNGYESPNKNNILKCNSVGQWVGKIIECSPVDCGKVIVIADGEVDSLYTTFGSIIDYKCNEGFKLIGEPKATCQASGDWTEAPTCKKIICSSALNIENGISVADDPQSDYGSSIHYKCLEGYVLMGSANRTCGNNGKWSGVSPSCKPVLCQKPTDINNVKVIGDIYEYNNSITFECYAGFKLIGSPMLTCLSNGEWSDNFPTCSMIVCSEPDKVPHAKWITKNLSKFSLNSQITNSKEQRKIAKLSKSSKLTSILSEQQEEIIYRLGYSIQYTCAEGYFIMFTDVLECTANGWSSEPPRCSPITCNEPLQIRDGYVIGNDYTFESVISYKCNEGYELYGPEKRTCKANKEWTDIEPYCRQKECPMPAQIHNGKTLYDTIRYQSVVTYTCLPGFRLEGISSRICQANEQWSGQRPVCVEIFCDEPEVVAYGISDIEHLKVGGTIRYSCMEGYKLNGKSILNCQMDGTWDDKVPNCEQIDCGPPQSNPRLVISGSSNKYAAKIHYSCDRGYKLHGESFNFCPQTGIWSHEVPQCELVICEVPITPEHSVQETQDTDDAESIETFSISKRKRKSKKGKRKSKKKSSAPVKYTLEKPMVYKVDDELVYNCDEGWEPIGENTLRCTQDGVWSSEPPICQRITCGEPQVPRYGKYIGENFKYEDLIEFTCDQGYEIRGNPIIACAKNGEWTNENPKCEPVFCGKPSPVFHSEVFYLTPEHGMLHHFGSTATYTCNQGYQLKGSSVLTCKSSGKWVGYEELPICLEMLCDEPPELLHASAIQNDDVMPQVATYSCDFGYEAFGDVTIDCNLGKWSSPNMTCNPVNCYEPTIPINGKITANHFMLGSVANYSCIHGHELIGNPSVECKGDGLWYGEIPKCEPVNCSIPEDPVNGGVTYGSTLFTSVVSYYCNEGYELKGDLNRLCSAYGKWSGHLPQCHKISCGELRPPYKGYMIGVGQHYEDVVKFTCEKGYVLKGNSTVICQSDGTWSDSSQRCENVYCGPPLFIPNGSPPMDNEHNYYGHTISYECNEGHLPRGDLSSKCLKNGSWSKVKGQCSLVSCGRPKINKDGSVILGRSFYYKDKVKVQCPSGAKPNGPSTLTCLSDGTWSGQPSCVNGCSRRCQNGGICIRDNVCSCPNGFKGRTCQHAICTLPCLNGGSCVKPFECTCLEGFEGDRCQTPLCPLSCLNRGVCTGPHRCTCLPGYAGTRCQTPVCEIGCGTSGKCIGPNVCLCQSGETGMTCNDDYSSYDYDEQQEQKHATHFNDWDLAFFRQQNFKYEN